MNCRNCGALLQVTTLDLGSAPVSNDYLSVEALDRPETWYPLKVLLCDACWLLQTLDFLPGEDIFRDEYAYFSSTSSSWVSHAERFVAQAVDSLRLNSSSLVMEVAANDGYLLQFVQSQGVPCLGIEPTCSTATAGRRKGLRYEEVFLGTRTAEEIVASYGRADLVVANNVIAHVPDLDDFISGLRTLLKPNGVLTVEFPTAANLVEQGLFDTVYHEHFSYFSLSSLADAFNKRGLVAFRVEEIPTHGGSLRVSLQRSDSGQRDEDPTVSSMLESEARRGVTTHAYYSDLQLMANRTKVDLLSFLIDEQRRGRTVAAYGAAAKGSTLLNFAGVRSDLLAFVVDRSESKQGRYLPGSRIPSLEERALEAYRPDSILVLPWNLKDEIASQLEYTRAWGGRLFRAVPQLEEL